MRPRSAGSGEQDLFRSRLDQVIDMDHALAKLAADDRLGGFLEEKFGAGICRWPPPAALPTRLMAGLAILKHSYNLSDEVCASSGSRTRYQYFCGEEFFQHRCRSIAPR